MKKVSGIAALILIANLCQAEPGQIDKSAVVASVSANSASRDGSWLKWTCEDYKTWHEDPGSLWKGTDTRKENLGAGLCAGFISGVTHAPGMSPCIGQQPLKPELILQYLQSHPERLGDNAGKLVVDALSANANCNNKEHN